MKQIESFVQREFLVLVPVLYLIGTGLKKASCVKDKYIPVILGVVGVILSCLHLGDFGFVGITQGILCAGASVYVNQLIKQGGKA